MLPSYLGSSANPLADLATTPLASSTATSSSNPVDIHKTTLLQSRVKIYQSDSSEQYQNGNNNRITIGGNNIIEDAVTITDSKIGNSNLIEVKAIIQHVSRSFPLC
jgi:hypothetical protein